MDFHLSPLPLVLFGVVGVTAVACLLLCEWFYVKCQMSVFALYALGRDLPCGNFPEGGFEVY